jgi:hypothetical protein
MPCTRPSVSRHLGVQGCHVRKAECEQRIPVVKPLLMTGHWRLVTVTSTRDRSGGSGSKRDGSRARRRRASCRPCNEKSVTFQISLSRFGGLTAIRELMEPRSSNSPTSPRVTRARCPLLRNPSHSQISLSSSGGLASLSRAMTSGLSSSPTARSAQPNMRAPTRASKKQVLATSGFLCRLEPRFQRIYRGGERGGASHSPTRTRERGEP